MKLRVFMAVMSCLADEALGQAAPKMPRVAVLHFSGQAHFAHCTSALTSGLEAAGYSPGKNLVLEVRDAGGSHQQLERIANELAKGFDVVVAPSGTAAVAMRKAAPSLPVVFTYAVNPVSQGLAKSLQRPGANTTGLTSQATEVIVKRFEVLREVVPGMKKLAILHFAGAGVGSSTRAAKSVGVETQAFGGKSADDVERAFRDAAAWHADAMTVVDDPAILFHRHKIIELARKYRMPVGYGSTNMVDIGGLLSYGADHTDLCRRGAAYVAKILAGARPGELPVEQASKFELVINAKTAKALGIKLPDSLLLRADKVID